jgi:peptidoglycan/xylan/chitin deacetylase (PgdA/CDA1 family)
MPKRSNEFQRAELKVSGPVLAVLAYHKIGAPPSAGWETWFYVPAEVFARHLDELRRGGWQVLDVEALVRGLTAPDTLPRRAAVITFDDGYRSNLEIAVPWLQRFGYPAVMFVPTAFVGDRNTFDAGQEPDEPICNWDDLRALSRLGVSVQSHGVSHRGFSALNEAEQEQELLRSRLLLEDELSTRVALFSFPYGDSGSDPARVPGALAQAGYSGGCLYGGGLNALPVRDRYSLARLAMGPDSDLQAELGSPQSTESGAGLEQDRPGA